MYSPASPGALSPDVPFPVSLSRASRASVTNVGDRRENVGRLAFYVMAMVNGTVPVQKHRGGPGHTDITQTNLTKYQTNSPEDAHAQPRPHCVTFRYTLNPLYFVPAASGAAGASLGVTSSSAPGAARRFD